MIYMQISLSFVYQHIFSCVFNGLHQCAGTDEIISCSHHTTAYGNQIGLVKDNILSTCNNNIH